jgi:hypothetical protein
MWSMGRHYCGVDAKWAQLFAVDAVANAEDLKKEERFGNPVRCLVSQGRG